MVPAIQCTNRGCATSSRDCLPKGWPGGQTSIRLADQHHIEPWGAESWIKGLSGGSDDHAGLSIARAHTVFPGPATVAGFRAAIRNYATKPGGLAATPDLVCHNIYGVVAGALLHSGQLSFGLGEQTTQGSSLNRTLERFADYLDDKDRKFDIEDAILKGHEDSTQDQIHEIIDRILVRANRDALKTLAEAVTGGQISAAADALPDLVKLLVLSIPYLSGVAVYGREGRKAHKYCRDLGVPLDEKPNPRVAILCDTLDDIQGVSVGLRRLAAQAKSEGLDLRLVGLGDGEKNCVDADGVARIPCVLWHRPKEFPSIAFGIPSLTSLLHYIVSEGIDLVQCSTPGPMGLVGLMVARMAGVPVIGQYNTDLPEFVARSNDGLDDLLLRGLVLRQTRSSSRSVASGDRPTVLFRRRARKDSTRATRRGPRPLLPRSPRTRGLRGRVCAWLTSPVSFPTRAAGSRPTIATRRAFFPPAASSATSSFRESHAARKRSNPACCTEFLGRVFRATLTTACSATWANWLACCAGCVPISSKSAVTMSCRHWFTGRSAPRGPSALRMVGFLPSGPGARRASHANPGCSPRRRYVL